MTNHFNEVSKHLNLLGRRNELSNVFNDLLTLAICSFHRTNVQSGLTQKDAQNENLYMSVIRKYQKDEIGTFPKILGHLMLNAQENPYSDILGEYFMQHITHGQNGQFFTPEPICKMMAMMQGDENITGKKIADPACGSGRMLLQFAESNPDNYFFGADNSATCAKMTALNFFLNGLRGEAAWMDSLSMQFYGGWYVNMNGLGILPIEKEQSYMWSAPPEPKQVLLPSQEGILKNRDNPASIQLSLF